MSLELKLDENRNPEPTLLDFTPEAKEVYKIWQQANTDMINTEENEILAGVYSKLEIYVARLSLILEVLWWSCDNDNMPLEHISETCIRGAIDLVKYFRCTASKVNEIISNTNPLDRMTEDKQKLYHALPESFKKDEGLKISGLLKIPPDTFNKWLSKCVKKQLLRKLTTGNYQKML